MVADALEMRLMGLSLDPSSKTPVALLREINGQRDLPLWLTPLEAMSISLAQSRMPQPLPLTHTLLLRVIESLHARLTAVEIAAIREGILCASLVLHTDGEDLRMECRPADALALALTAVAPIYVSLQVLQEVDYIRAHAVPGEEQDALMTTSGTPLRQETPATAATPATSAEEDREDKTWSELLRRMDPVSPRKN